MILGLSAKTTFIALGLMTVLWIISLTPKDSFITKTKCLLDTSSSQPEQITDDDDGEPVAPKFEIKNKVAVMTDTTFSNRHIPLVMHFHAVLGPDWPIVYYTSQETYEEHFKSNPNASAIWTRAVEAGNIDVRILPDRFDLTSRRGVNLYLASPWLWEQLAPAQHVLVFQADAILCANAHKTVDDFLEYDFIGATLSREGRIYNGGLSLRNRTMMLDILSEGSDFAKETAVNAKEGEDVWFSRKMDARGARLPENDVAMQFACEYYFHIELMKQPLGYHKVHKRSPKKIGEISKWCPEIALAAPGPLGRH
ncbi:hypothetical protein ABW19_dt0204606 [Dactylella cylindrospora]|nr:hypothetical protein ABW19_dt0204606 [Dactylella cylindrospora]